MMRLAALVALILYGTAVAAQSEGGPVPDAAPPPPAPILRLPGSLRLALSGEVRLREEISLDLYSPADPQGQRSFETLRMRTRLALSFEVDESVSAIVELQDVRRLGEEGSTTADTEGVDLRRAQILLRRLFDEPLSLELGRYTMKYGDERIIGELDWVDQGRVFDGFRLSYAPEGSFVDLFGARVRDTLLSNDDHELVGVYAGTRRLLSAELQGYAIYVRDDLPATELSPALETGFATLGARLAHQGARLDAMAELALQSGTVRNLDLSAWAVAATVGYTFPDMGLKPRIGVGLDYATGDEQAGDGETEQFQVLFPTNHRHFGYADLTAWSNLLDLRASVSVRPSEKVTLSADWHHFRLASSAGPWVNAAGAVIRPPAPGAPEALGDELDLLLVARLSKPLTLLAGWSRFFPGDYVEATGEAPTADFGYLQLRLAF
jgi:hypothetical protein